jgi:hypothetical protein
LPSQALAPGWHTLVTQVLEAQCWPAALQSASVLQATHTPPVVSQTSTVDLHTVSLWHAVKHWFWKQPRLPEEPEEQSALVAQSTQAPLLHTFVPGHSFELMHDVRVVQVPAMQLCPKPHSAGLVHWTQT